MHKNVYLAGPIMGRTYGEANDWRDYMKDALAAHGIGGISPLRCEPLIGDRYEAQYADPRFGTARAIRSKNLFDVQRCDITVAYMPEGFNPTYGTVCELSWAYALGKPAILVSDDPEILRHPVIDGESGWIVNTLEEALDICVGILKDYQ